MSDEKVYVFIPERKSEEVIVLLNKVSEYKRRLEFAEIHIDELNLAIEKLTGAMGKKSMVKVCNREDHETREFEVQGKEIIKV